MDDFLKAQQKTVGVGSVVPGYHPTAPDGRSSAGDGPKVSSRANLVAGCPGRRRLDGEELDTANVDDNEHAVKEKVDDSDALAKEQRSAHSTAMGDNDVDDQDHSLLF